MIKRRKVTISDVMKVLERFARDNSDSYDVRVNQTRDVESRFDCYPPYRTTYVGPTLTSIQIAEKGFGKYLD